MNSNLAGSVAVIIPCYEAGDLLKEALASALAQTIDVEVIICDDGSTGAETRIVLDKVAAAGDPRVTILRLDRIYVRNATVSHPWTLPRKPWSHLSDHAPLAVEIHL